MMNISLIGRVGADAEVKDLGNNQVINFNVAVSESFTKNGQKETKTTWFQIQKWGNNTAVAQYIKKGNQIYVSGKPANRAFLGSDGTAQIANGINAFEIELLGSANDSSQPSASPQPSTARPQANTPNSFVDDDIDNLPF